MYALVKQTVVDHQYFNVRHYLLKLSCSVVCFVLRVYKCFFKFSDLKVENPSQPNDEGITPLHNAVCAGHHHTVKFLLDFGVNVNAADSDGWSVRSSQYNPSF